MHSLTHSYELSKNDNNKFIAWWLLACCLMVFAIVVVGGATRLTHSGLSITEWQPILGALPPLSQQDWMEPFAKYQLTPEYRQVNHAMSLEEFKGIFWWEYAHRLLGRAIGMVFLLPLLWFVWKRRIGKSLAWRLGAIFLLGGLQGALGWYMVQSGLVDDPRVSQFRLTAHLSLALLIFAAMFWTALDLLVLDRAVTSPSSRLRPSYERLRRWSWAVLGLVAYMVVTGGFVAGIRAGFAYNTFPLMNGHVVPPEMFLIEPWWKNFFYNMATVQFDHRLGAWLLAFVIPCFWLLSRREMLSPAARLACNLLVLALVLQVCLGIATLLLRVPVPLAAAHQAGAVILFATILACVHTLRR